MSKIVLSTIEKHILDHYGRDMLNDYLSVIPLAQPNTLTTLNGKANEIYQALTRAGKFDLARIVGVWYDKTKNKILNTPHSSVQWLGVN